MEELKKQVYELNKDVLAELSALDKDKVYVLELNCGYAPKETVIDTCRRLYQCLSEAGIKLVLLPVYGESNIKITELSKYKD